MSAITGTNIGSQVAPYDTEDNYPTHLAVYGKGGLRSVANNTQKNAIKSSRLEEGMIVHDNYNDVFWKLKSGFHNPLVDADFESLGALDNARGDFYVDPSSPIAVEVFSSQWYLIPDLSVNIEEKIDLVSGSSAFYDSITDIGGGQIRVEAINHNVEVGDLISMVGGPNDGLWEVKNVYDADHFDLFTSYLSDSAGIYTKASKMVIQTAGTYKFQFHFNIEIGESSKDVRFGLFKNNSLLDFSERRITLLNTSNKQPICGAFHLQLEEGDVLYPVFAYPNITTNGIITLDYGDVVIDKV